MLRNWRAQVLAAIVATLVVTEVFSYAAIALSASRLTEPVLRRASIYADQSRLIEGLLSNRKSSRLQPDSVLGWRYRSGFSSTDDTVSSQGLRGSRLYTASPVESTLRAAAFGDSFTYGEEVSSSESWPAVAERLDSSVQVLNYGVGGYGVDQAMLRYRDEGRTLMADVVLIGFVMDDIRRVVNVYRRFISVNEGPAFKPRFLIDSDGDLALVPPPVKSFEDYAALLSTPQRVRAFGALDQWYRPLVYENPLYDVSASVRLASAMFIRLSDRYFDPERAYVHGEINTRSEAFRIQLLLFRDFAELVRQRGSRPVVLFFPDRVSVQALARSERPLYGSLRDSTLALGISVLELDDAFVATLREHAVSALFMPGGHYSALGNSVVAAAVVAELARYRGSAPDSGRTEP